MNAYDVWLCELPDYEGHEQRGVRPCVLLTKPYLELITIAPLTSQLEALRFNHTLKIEKDEANKLEKDSVALLFQIQAIDMRRALKRIGNVNKKQRKEIQEYLKKYLEL